MIHTSIFIHLYFYICILGCILLLITKKTRFQTIDFKIITKIAKENDHVAKNSVRG